LVQTLYPSRSHRHQRGDTECGVYSLYYIRQRLEGTPARWFATDTVPDDAMIKFRKHLFSKVKIV